MVGCGNNENPDTETEILKDENAIVDTTTILQASQLSFDDALADIRENKKAEAVNIIKKALQQITTEKENIKVPEVKEKMENTVGTIKQIADSLQDGNDINIKNLRKAFSRAELLLARHYFINIEVPEAIDKTYVAMDKTAQLMEAGILHGDDEMKQDAGTIVADTKSLLQKAKNNREQYKDELKKHSEKLKAFLEKHTR
jgi:F0F1-type ATP synthase membrane subunit b/b'